MSNTQPNALRLADALEVDKWHISGVTAQMSADELRRLHNVNKDMLSALQEVVRVFDRNPSSITDTVWVTGDRPETLYDFVCTTIAKASDSTD